MEGTFVQLYKDSEWVAQFRDVTAATKYVFDLGEDMNSYELRFEPSKYKK